jgi:threonyl-tRNA synthetase
VTRDDPRALELIRHDAAHVMAEAVQELWPGTQVTIGPVIENGFLLRLQARLSRDARG